MFHEYPRHMHGRGGAFLVVQDDEEKAAALAAGWALWPVPDVAPDPVTERRKPGRPKKVAD